MNITTSQLIHQLLENSAASYPGNTAVVSGGNCYTYQQLNFVVESLSASFQKRGIVPGDRVAFLFDNSFNYIATYYAILKTGAIAVPLNTSLKPLGLRTLLKQLEPKLFVVGSRFERLVKAVNLSLIPSLEFLILENPILSWEGCALPVCRWDSVVEEKGEFGHPVVYPDDAACIIYTSGSAGEAKGVILTHRNIIANTVSICAFQRLTANDRHMVVLPFFYVMGMSLLNTHVAVGATLVINNQFAYPAAVVEQMAQESVTGFSGVPSTFAHLLYRSPFRDYCADRLPSLRFCAQAGGHMSCALKMDLLSCLPETTELYIMYGATEASARLSYVEPGRLLEKIESIGKPIPGVDFCVVSESGDRLSVRETGEIVASGENIMLGYWRDDAATQQALSNHGYRTGDLGYFDEDGYFFLCGRKDDQLKVSGHRVNPKEVEDAIMQTGRALETVVFGVPDDLQGYRLVSLLVAKNNFCDVATLSVELGRQLPRYKCPNDIKLVTMLPKLASGKVDRKKCLELI